MLSLLLNLKNRPCLVVGSGAVGRRKVQTLFESGAKVRVVSLDVQPVDVRAEFLCEPCSAKHLQGIFLTFAAATSAVNAQVVLDTQSQGILVSSADHPESGDFILPATVLLSSTQGQSGTHSVELGLSLSLSRMASSYTVNSPSPEGLTPHIFTAYILPC